MSNPNGNPPNTQQQFDFTYIHTIDGRLKIIQIIVAMVAFISYQAIGWCGSDWFGIVTISSAVISSILLFFFVAHIHQVFGTINWAATEMLYCSINAVVYLIGWIYVATCIRNSAALLLPMALGIINMLLYAFDAYIKIRRARGQQTTVVTTTTI